jgi:LmbE family N-acetylglucosaminyl deacetylase/ActR/RegA family two-component response regulator
MVDQPYIVVVVEDDPGVAFYTKTVLEKRGCVVEGVSSPLLACDAVRRLAPDVVITDIEMPGMTGLELIKEIRAERPGTPIVVMTAHVSIDYAVAALRSQADEFLSKPVSSTDLIAVVRRLADEFRRAKATRWPVEVVLAIGAHPDDVEIGVGGILAAHRAAGDSITILTLSRGERGGEADDRQNESLAAAEILGARLFLEDLTDTQISSFDPTVGIIERVVAEVNPTIVYTHSNHDRHQDHRAVHEATLVATRKVRTVACYQSPSATVDFRPNRFVSIDGFTATKNQVLASFDSQADIRWYLAPDFVEATARYWSRHGGGKSSEPLEIVRESIDLSVSRRKITQAVQAVQAVQAEKARQARGEAIL